MTSSIDPAVWMILFPFVVACIAYNYVFRKWGMSALATRRLIRWPLAFSVAFLSLWLEMVWILNTFGS